jgi:hypothetical protein
MLVGHCVVYGGLNVVKSLDVYYGPGPWPIEDIANIKPTYNKPRGYEKNNLWKKCAGMLARNTCYGN